MKEISKDIQLFQLLLKEVGTVFLKEHTASHTDISRWKGEDIVHFQEDLRSKTQSSVSEKWFYSYVKKRSEKLPRIDILNVLSNYAGFENWHAFRQEHRNHLGSRKSKSNFKNYWIIGAIVCLLGLIAIYAFVDTSKQLHFCFQDMDTGNAITRAPIDITVFHTGESPSYYKTDSLGCFRYRTSKNHIRFIARSPYYKTDTIYRGVLSETSESIRLRTDDYALMLHYYGNSNVKDWKKRRKELEQLISDDALIFEVLPHQLGVERYQKDAFINKLTTPTESLKKLAILKTEYREGKIVKLKFRITYEK